VIAACEAAGQSERAAALREEAVNMFGDSMSSSGADSSVSSSGRSKSIATA
jgi:hypothetical protein